MLRQVRRVRVRDFHLRFAADDWVLEYTGEHEQGVWYHNPDYAMFDLLEGDESDLPVAPGAYVVGTADNTLLTYPWGTSPIYYVGQSKNLSKRISQHAEHGRSARDDHSAKWWYPRYQYAGAFGGHVVWWSVTEDVEPGNLEAALVDAFYMAYGAIPVGNMAWPKGKATPVD